jgi:hypothetical protein
MGVPQTIGLNILLKRFNFGWFGGTPISRNLHMHDYTGFIFGFSTTDPKWDHNQFLTTLVSSLGAAKKYWCAFLGGHAIWWDLRVLKADTNRIWSVGNLHERHFWNILDSSCESKYEDVSYATNWDFGDMTTPWRGSLAGTLSLG